MRNIFILFTILSLLSSPCAFAEWEEPREIITFGWGKDIGKLGFNTDDMGDNFPTFFIVSHDGNIFIPDGINRRLYIYSQNGDLIGLMRPEKDKPGMAFRPLIIGELILFRFKDEYLLYDYSGKLIKFFKEFFSNYIYVIDEKIIVKNLKDKKYYKYTTDGQLLETYKEKPLELGVVKERSLGGKRYRVTIKYPDKTIIINDGPYAKYVRGCNNMLYGFSARLLDKYNSDGELIAKLVTPKNQYKVIRPAGGGLEELSEVIVEYGYPVLAPNGDVYTWKRTKDTYSILKWIWIESRDAPVNLKASASDGKIALTWATPKQDANSVKAYEIYRSSDVCGPFNKIDKVKKGVMRYTDKEVKEGETYYYQVCAERGRGYSGYSNKAVGSIKN